MKKILALLWILVLCLGLLLSGLPKKEPRTSLGIATPDTATPDIPVVNQSTPDTPERVRLQFYNGQPVLQLIYDQLTQEFFEKTGIRVVTTSSDANLEEAPPVLFSVKDASGLTRWECLDLSDTVACANLADGGFTLVEDGKTLGIASEAEPFGLIFDTALLARVGHTAGDMTSFSDLKAVAEYITAHEEELGFGAFAAPDAENRFADLLSSLPVDIRPLWDLYSKNRTQTEISVFSLGTMSDMKRMSAGGEVQLEMLPLYTGAAGEESRGLYCFGTHYWCVRADATQEEIDGALAFLNFLVSPRTDGTVPVDDLGILAPYRQAVYTQNAMEQRFRSDIAQGKILNVCGPLKKAPDGFSWALRTYAADPTDENWTAVTELLK